ncbi:rhodanese-like domain-containing protein [Acinetobacter puyangensis]|uniref:Thiosulfate sulfurtransferase n=1 Tax=Acinetobacter puyangensis TaxID=1096779 RepID=A0A240EAA9_9GAMM|nr:rhodanese-like domain-containing protein [Acinetobacter puyangensis]SNX45658.1 thiosulfate sulfurtransferase [Acinetobacter puyangensis]
MNAKVETQFLNTTAYSQLNQQQAQEILEKAQNYAAENELDFTGSLTPQDAWQLFQSGQAVIVDVRTNEERKFVGYVPETTHIAWATGTSFNRNPRFLKELENKVGKDKTILLLCRSGNRSALAAAAAYQAGFEQVYNILEGFEGDLNEQQQRNQGNGWRVHQLPWVQD